MCNSRFLPSSLTPFLLDARSLPSHHSFSILSSLSPSSLLPFSFLPPPSSILPLPSPSLLLLHSPPHFSLLPSLLPPSPISLLPSLSPLFPTSCSLLPSLSPFPLPVPLTPSLPFSVPYSLTPCLPLSLYCIASICSYFNCAVLLYLLSCSAD